MWYAEKTESKSFWMSGRQDFLGIGKRRLKPLTIETIHILNVCNEIMTGETILNGKLNNNKGYYHSWEFLLKYHSLLSPIFVIGRGWVKQNSGSFFTQSWRLKIKEFSSKMPENIVDFTYFWKISLFFA